MCFLAWCFLLACQDNLNMKKLLLMLPLFVAFSWANAQTKVEVTVENQRLVNGKFYFDVMLSDDAGPDFYLGYADIVLTDAIFTNGAFSSASVNYINGTTTLLNAGGTTATGYDNVTVTSSIGAGANANRVIININFPAFANQTEFDAKIAKIDGTRRRLGTFQMVTTSKNGFYPNHAFYTVGTGIKTKIYEAAATTPWNQTRITTANSTLRSAASVLATAPATFPGQFPSGFTSTPQSPTSVKLDWTNGTHDGVIVLMRQSDATTNTTIAGLSGDTTVGNVLAYTAQTNFSGVADTNRVGSSPYYVAYVGTGTTVTITGLTAGQQYKYVIIPFNGVAGYSAAYASPSNMATNAASLVIDRPSVEIAPTWNLAGLYLFNNSSNSSTQMNINWYIADFANIATNDANYNVNKDSILFIAIAAGSAHPTVAPALGSSYYPTVGESYTPASYASGDTLGAAPVAYAVARVQANAASGTVTFTGLTANTSYRVLAFPMRGNTTNVDAANYNYSSLQQDVRFTTPTPITAPAAGDLATSFTGTPSGNDSTLNISWTNPTNPNISGIMVMVRPASATDFSPVNGNVYGFNSSFTLAPNQGQNRIVYRGTGTSVTVTGLKPNQRYHFTVVPYLGTVADSNLAYVSDGPTNLWARSNSHTYLSVTAQVYLEGPWNGTDMNETLTIPTNHPFDSSSFFNYNGTETYNATNTPDAVDWVLLELRRVGLSEGLADANLAKVPGTSPSVNVGRRAAILNKDGKIVGVDGNDSLLFQITQEGKYYVVVYHRNHIPIMSANAADTARSISLTSNGNLFLATNVAGGTTNAFDLGSGNVAMLSGNANTSNFVVDGDDRTKIWAARNNSATNLYRLEDVNLDTDVDAADRAAAWNNRTKNAYSSITAP